MKKNTLLKIIALLFAALSMSMVGCSKKEPTPQSNTTSQSNQSYNSQDPLAQAMNASQQKQDERKKAIAAAEAADAAAKAALPQGDPNTPLSDYRLFNDSDKIIYLYYGIHKPVDYDSIALKLNGNMRIADTFKWKDKLDQLKPSIDKEIADWSKNRYIKLNMVLMADQYSIPNKSFKINSLNYIATGSFLQSWTNYGIDFSNSDKFDSLNIADETLAREIDSLMTKNQGGVKAVGYAFIQGTESNRSNSNMNVKMKIMKIDVIDNAGKVIYSE